MPRRFNVSGPCVSTRHYMIEPIRRLPDLRYLIDDVEYFVLHAPRQVGKTTAMLAFANQLTAEGTYAALLVSVEAAAPFSAHPGVAELGASELAIIDGWRDDALERFPEEFHPPAWPEAPPGRRIVAALKAWCKAITRPLVLFIDEIDALRNETLITLLRQLRSGFIDRPNKFPQSIALIGMRDVRDYKVASGGSDRLNTSSPFNIKTESLTMRNFIMAEVAELYGQHTDGTGQKFEQEAIDLAFKLTDGQPWLVNALARRLVMEVAPDPAITITEEHVKAAKEIMIKRKDTHLDSLAERLRESRVRRVIEPIIAGMDIFPDMLVDDLQYSMDIGLVKRSSEGQVVIANPIYHELVPRTLASEMLGRLSSIESSWLNAAGQIDINALRESFIAFWMQHGESLMARERYHEIAAQLVLMAYLDRVANAGGTVEREYAIGRGRIDLYLRKGDLRLGIEVKVWRYGQTDPQRRGLVQLESYLAQLGQNHGWLVIFDGRDRETNPQNKKAKVEERPRKTGERKDRPSTSVVSTARGRRITVIRL